MGQDKALLPFGGEILLARVVRVVREAAEDVVLVAREGQTLPEGFDAVRDPAEGLGPLAGIAAGLRHIKSDRAFVTGCDAPLLRSALIRKLLNLSDGYDAAVPLIDDHFMTIAAVYARSVGPVAEALVTRRELRTSGLLDHIRVRAVYADELRDVDPDLDSFRTCNTPADYEEALRRWRTASP
jgi:molybdopterin-guanine dinucleotide biosynthesis protein A